MNRAQDIELTSPNSRHDEICKKGRQGEVEKCRNQSEQKGLRFSLKKALKSTGHVIARFYFLFLSLKITILFLCVNARPHKVRVCSDSE